MSWCNPEYWTDDKEFGIDELEQFSSHFKEQLAEPGFDWQKAIKEWKHIQRHIKQNLPGKSALQVWKSILQYKRTKFPNICLLVEIIFSLSGSKSSIERAFSVLTMMLTDKRLKSWHDLLEMRMLVKINNKNWNNRDREEIIKRALEIYVSSKRRKRKLDAPESQASSIIIESDHSDAFNDSDHSDVSNDDSVGDSGDSDNHNTDSNSTGSDSDNADDTV